MSRTDEQFLLEISRAQADLQNAILGLRSSAANAHAEARSVSRDHTAEDQLVITTSAYEASYSYSEAAARLNHVLDTLRGADAYRSGAIDADGQRDEDDLSATNLLGRLMEETGCTEVQQLVTWVADSKVARAAAEERTVIAVDPAAPDDVVHATVFTQMADRLRAQVNPLVEQMSRINNPFPAPHVPEVAAPGEPIGRDPEVGEVVRGLHAISGEPVTGKFLRFVRSPTADDLDEDMSVAIVELPSRSLHANPYWFWIQQPIARASLDKPTLADRSAYAEAVAELEKAANTLGAE